MARLRSLTERFLARKKIHGVGGLELSQAMRVRIALQACIPILNLGLGWYRGWVEVLVYPDAFLVHHDYRDDAGVVHHEADRRIGESWSHGPVILSWQHAEQDTGGAVLGNVVIHEFAHKLDLLNGEPNGMPPLHKDMDLSEWTRAFSAAYADFCQRYHSGEPTPFDAYGAEDPGEFFAVFSEVFFVQPALAVEVYPRVYEQLARFYRQDPVSRSPA